MESRTEVVDEYLAHLGVAVSGPPSVALLRALHRAHVERVPWHNLDLVTGAVHDQDPRAAAARIAAGRGGHCFELNGAFAMLLTGLGFAVRTHRAGIHGRYQRESPGATGHHLALTVSGLPADDAPDGAWLVDVAAGDLLHDPIPLTVGAHRTGGYEVVLRRDGTEPDGWRVDHDKRGGSRGVEISSEPHSPADRERSLRFLAGDPKSPLRFSTLVQRRHSTGADILFGPVLSRADGNIEISDADHWLAVLAEVFHLSVDAFDPGLLDRLWQRAAAAKAMLSAR